MHIRQLGILIVASGSMATTSAGCGDDDGKTDGDAGGDPIDASTVVADVTNGVVCPGAVANYSGDLVTTGALNDGTTILFAGDLNADSPPDRLQLEVAVNATTPLGTFTLPTTEWSVSLCLDDSDGSCTMALQGFSGTLRVDSVDPRLKASLDRVIFVDNLTTPTCSASLTQSSLDVAIDAI